MGAYPPPTPNSQKKKHGSCWTLFFMALISLCLMAIFGLLLRRYLHFENNLEAYVDIAHVALDSSNYNKMPNVAAGTVVVTAKDGSMGIIDDTDFSIMTVCYLVFSAIQ